MAALMRSAVISNSKTVVVAGASGYIGKFVCKELTSRGHNVITIGRSNSRAADTLNCRNVNVDVCSQSCIDEIKSSIPPFDVLISCLGSRSGGKKDAWSVELGANKNLLFLARSRHATQFVLLSAICVQKPRLEFQFAKLAFEKTLIESGISYTIVRPTAYFKSLAGQIENVKAGKPFCVFGDGTNTACKPISGHDLAVFICDCIELAQRRNKILPVGGPGPPVTLKEQGEMLFRLTEKPCKFRRIPSATFKVMNTLMVPFALISESLSDRRELFRIAHYYATESMLYWDQKEKRYSSEQTPEYGGETLESFYKKALNSNVIGHELSGFKLF